MSLRGITEAISLLNSNDMQDYPTLRTFSLDRLSPIREILERLKQGEKEIGVTGLKGSVPAFLLSHLKRELPRPFVIITPQVKDAEDLCRDLGFYLSPDERDLFLSPPWESSPFESFSSHPSTTARRIEILYNLLTHRTSLICIFPVKVLMQKVMPHDTVVDSAVTVKTGMEIDRDWLVGKLIQGGYLKASLVEGVGEFGVRGGVLDFFPPQAKRPVRIEFFGDTIESMRVFDPVSQRSIEEINELTVLPVREIVLTDENRLRVITRIKSAPGLSPEESGKLIEKVNSPYLHGLEYLMSFFYPELESILNYFPPNAMVFLYEPAGIEREIDLFRSEIEEGFSHSMKKSLLLSEMRELYLSPEEVSYSLKGYDRILLEEISLRPDENGKVVFSTESNEDIRKELLNFRSPQGGFSALVDKINGWREEGNRIFLVSPTPLEAKRVIHLLEDYEVGVRLSEVPFTPTVVTHMDPSGINVSVGDLSQGFRFPALRLVIITEEEIFGEKKKVAVAPRPPSYFISDFSELKTDDYVVHVDHGIGIYRGVRQLRIEDSFHEYLTIEYLGGDRLYIPMERLNLVQKYRGADGYQPKVDRLGDASWKRRKKKTQQSLKHMAKELLDLYATRKMVQGFSFSSPDHYYREFEATFPYEETPDQLRAIEEVIEDMEQPRPMDRLICGDVGYGKTEVALRSSFKAVMDGKQVTLLAPTTILAQQHYQTFCARFKDYPVTVEVLSRFRTKKEQEGVIRGLKEGKVDIVIGTHRLLQKDMGFKDLGLVIVDEEQRFGVAHKERLKRLKQQVDVLALTATPIPRTLYMSMVGIRDLSTINTPPQERLAIKTYVVTFDEEVIREAVVREINRGGQVFFVHDRVRSIPAMARFLQRLIPEANLGIAHGQIHERDLEKVMLAFLKREINLLLCTTIIESGLDFPQANTIVINRADKLGLAQLYQLRGRVGRSRYLAYAYFLIPGESLLSQEARERLAALVEFSELSSGFRLAARDLEIRGAGNLLGSSQSGHIAAVGLDMYTQLLENAVKELKGEEIPLEIEPEIHLRIPAYIPEDYIGEINQRLVMYKRLASHRSEEELQEIRDELIDRFGRIPESVFNLFEVVRLKNLLKTFLIRRLDFNGREIILSFDERAYQLVDKILNLINRQPRKYKFTPDHRLKLAFNNRDWKRIVEEVKKVLQ
jgi:transcription-repair coupling factor (superfamily II helicase)